MSKFEEDLAGFTPSTLVLGPELGPKLREWRKARRWTQGELASAAGLSSGFVSKLEAGEQRASPEVLLALIDGLLRGRRSERGSKLRLLAALRALKEACEVVEKELESG